MAAISIYKPRWFQNPLLLPLLAAVAATPWLAPALQMSNPLYLAVLAQIALFCLFFHRPVWAAASLIIGELMMSQHLFPLFGTEISLRLIWTIMALLLLFPILHKRGGIELGSGARRVFVPTVIFCLIATISNYVNTDLAYIIKDLRLIANWLVILILLPAVVKSEHDLKILALVILIAGSISAAVAVMQHYHFIGLPAFELVPGAWDGSRASGLSEGAVNLAFDLPLILIPIVSIYLLGGIAPDKRKFLPFLALIIAAALFFTETRSGMYALVPGLLVMLFLIKGKTRIKLLAIFLVFGVAFLGYSTLKQNRYTESFSDESSAAYRLVAWEAGFNIARDNLLLGIGHEEYKQVATEYASTVDPTLMETQGAGTGLGSSQIHNDFLGVWTWYGTLGLLAYLWLYVSIFRNFFGACRRSQSRFLKGFAIGCFGAVVTYIVNAGTHNALDSSTLLWILGGLSIAVTKLTLQQRPPKIEVAY